VHWPEGEETWVVHDELSQRIQCVQDKQKVLLLASTYNSTEYTMQQIQSDYEKIVSSSSMVFLSVNNNDGPVDNLSKSHEYSNKQLAQQMWPYCPLVPSDDNQHTPANVYFSSTDMTRGGEGLQTSEMDQRTFNKRKHRIIMQSILVKPVYSFNSSVIQTSMNDMVLMIVTLINIVIKILIYLSYTHDNKDRDWFRILAVPELIRIIIGNGLKKTSSY
jgi:hypothetical protein